jgi:PilZ domain
MSEQRINPRFGPLVIKTFLVVDGRTHEGYLTNVSTGGAFLALDDPPPLGTEVDFRALLPWRLGELRGSARVVWRNSSEASPSSDEHASLRGVGVAFTRMDEAADRLLHAYLARFVELAARLEEL